MRRAERIHVVDASVLAKTFLEEAGSPEVRAFLEEEQLAARPMEAPGVARYEVGRVIQRRFQGRKPAEQAEIHERALEDVRLLDAPLALTHRIAAGGPTFSDASYLALAVSRNAVLATADRDMARVARKLRLRTKAFPP